LDGKSQIQNFSCKNLFSLLYVMSLLNRPQTNLKGISGEKIGLYQTGGIGAGTSTVLTSPVTLAANTYSHLVLASSGVGIATFNLPATTVAEIGAIQKVTFGTIAADSATKVLSTSAATIYNGAAVITSINCAVGASGQGAGVVLQHLGNNDWRIVELNGAATITA
jgi:hypothetical protein